MPAMNAPAPFWSDHTTAHFSALDTHRDLMASRFIEALADAVGGSFLGG